MFLASVYIVVWMALYGIVSSEITEDVKLKFTLTLTLTILLGGPSAVGIRTCITEAVEHSRWKLAMTRKF